VTVTWTVANDGGSPITGYIITIRESDKTTFSRSASCDMTSSTLTTCTIPALAFTEEPFNLLWSSNIIAKVVAINSYGDSFESEHGSGAIILTKPDAPINLNEDIMLRTG
jgi:hypothetical protein